MNKLLRKTESSSPHLDECPLRKCIVDIYGMPYPSNPTKFLAGLLPFGADKNPWWWNGLNGLIPDHISGYDNRGHDGTFFCSEMVAHLFSAIGVLHEPTYGPHARRFYPVDFIVDSGASNGMATNGARPHELVESIYCISAY